MRPLLSLCMIVKNEEESLPACLGSVRGIADEIVVVDTGSSDTSPEIARKSGARVISHAWQDDFSDARNKSLEAATGEWILVLDADEELPPESGVKIPGLISAADVDGYEVRVRSILPESDAASYDESKIVRLFRNRSDYRYFMPIHEQIRKSIEDKGGRVLSSDLVIAHNGYSKKSVQGSVDRAERNLRMLRTALTSHGESPYIQYQLGATLMSVGKREEAYKELMKVLGQDYIGLGSNVLDKLYMKIGQLALEKGNYGEAIEFAEKSLEHNSHNEISQYVAALGYLYNQQIQKGYGYLIRIRESKTGNLRVGDQLEKLIVVCEQALHI